MWSRGGSSLGLSSLDGGAAACWRDVVRTKESAMVMAITITPTIERDIDETAGTAGTVQATMDCSLRLEWRLR